mmetsp:Transcript_82058/g.171767  ORF Transcript_82058/g.171767 Transcript_82058/m.171767 type:complete len:208 (+) Transcript_82058:883-1506(+)
MGLVMFNMLADTCLFIPLLRQGFDRFHQHSAIQTLKSSDLGPLHVRQNPFEFRQLPLHDWMIWCQQLLAFLALPAHNLAGRIVRTQEFLDRLTNLIKSILHDFLLHLVCPGCQDHCRGQTLIPKRPLQPIQGRDQPKGITIQTVDDQENHSLVNVGKHQVVGFQQGFGYHLSTLFVCEPQPAVIIARAVHKELVVEDRLVHLGFGRH